MVGKSLVNKGHTIDVLDKGYVKLVDLMGTDETIIEAARMSTGKGFVAWEPYEGHPNGDAALLEYLYKNGHMTPFEMCEVSIEVKAPIFVVREWFRHRTQSYNEMSARYIQMPDEHYVPSESRFNDTKHDTWRAVISNEQAGIYHSYEDMIENGVPKEVARINTPVSRYTRFRAKTDLRNWLDFLRQRLDPHAQYEIRVYAQAVSDIISFAFPRTYALFEEHTLHARKLSRQQFSTLTNLILRARAGDIIDWEVDWLYNQLLAKKNNKQAS